MIAKVLLVCCLASLSSGTFIKKLPSVYVAPLLHRTEIQAVPQVHEYVAHPVVHRFHQPIHVEKVYQPVYNHVYKQPIVQHTVETPIVEEIAHEHVDVHATAHTDGW